MSHFFQESQISLEESFQFTPQCILFIGTDNNQWVWRIVFQCVSLMKHIGIKTIKTPKITGSHPDQATVGR